MALTTSEKAIARVMGDAAIREEQARMERYQRPAIAQRKAPDQDLQGVGGRAARARQPSVCAGVGGMHRKRWSQECVPGLLLLRLKMVLRGRWAEERLVKKLCGR